MIKTNNGNNRAIHTLIIPYSTFLLFPFGAALIRGVYVTVLVTISRTCLMPLLVVFGLLASYHRPFTATSQSYGLRAPNGERIVLVALIGFALSGFALRGDSVSFRENAGDGGICRRMRDVDFADVG